MKKVILKIFVPDSFEIGECDKCPLSKRHSWEWEEYPYYCNGAECGFGFNKTTCPLEVDEKNAS